MINNTNSVISVGNMNTVENVFADPNRKVRKARIDYWYWASCNRKA